MSTATVHLFGRLGHDPEVRYTKSDQPIAVCNFSVAVDRTDEGTDWWKVTAWDKQAEFVGNNVAKGARIYVIGTPTLDEWEDDNGHHARLAVTARQVQAVDWAQDGQDAERPDPQPPPARAPQTKAARDRQEYRRLSGKHGRAG